MDWKFLMPAWFVSKREKAKLVERAKLTGQARKSRSFLGGIIEIGVEAELVDEPSPADRKR